ncbi:MAG: YraN family protein [Gammaproteobacteria bacterium]|jgi:putative endonuclease|nr:YraN family protein [Gammaproteobacteria bacterium]
MTKAGDSGYFFESLALEYLQEQGLKLHSRNVSCRFGELDLICQLAGQWVFVEVKYRRSNAYGGAAAAVTRDKQQKLRQTAAWFLQQQRSQAGCRFDVVAISGELPYQINWIINAF